MMLKQLVAIKLMHLAYKFKLKWIKLTVDMFKQKILLVLPLPYGRHVSILFFSKKAQSPPVVTYPGRKSSLVNLLLENFESFLKKKNFA